jgi:hypothetical protein
MVDIATAQDPVAPGDVTPVAPPAGKGGTFGLPTATAVVIGTGEFALPTGGRLHDQYGLDGAEVTDEVFTSPRSIVFHQAENRLHTIKAVLGD